MVLLHAWLREQKLKELITALALPALLALIVLVTLMSKFRWASRDIIFAGGAEEEHWTMSFLFDAMGAMSSNFNEYT